MVTRSNFSCFPQYFQYIFNFKSPITYVFVNCGCANYFFRNSANLICRGTDISKYFRESLGIRDNESRLYELGHSISYKTTCAPSEGSDQPPHLRSLSRAFAGHLVGSRGFKGG